MKKHKRTIL